MLKIYLELVIYKLIHDPEIPQQNNLAQQIACEYLSPIVNPQSSSALTACRKDAQIACHAWSR